MSGWGKLTILDRERVRSRTRQEWIEFEHAASYLKRGRWVFASTMADNPHWYTLRREWQRRKGGDEEFVQTVQTIRAAGYRTLFAGRQYIQMDVDNHFYWTMGAPLVETILINRKKIEDSSPYDAIADQYATLFSAPEFLVEDRRVIDHIGRVSDKAVLDIGCGQGLLLDYVRPAEYMGIDSSGGMLKHFLQRHAGYADCIIKTTLGAFSGGRYDLLLALMGTPSYFSKAERERVPYLLRPGGRAVLMYYAPDYHVRTHAETAANIPYTPFSEELAAEYRELGKVTVTPWDKYVIVDLEV